MVHSPAVAQRLHALSRRSSSAARKTGQLRMVTMAWGTSTHSAALSALSLKKGTAIPHWPSSQGSHSTAVTSAVRCRLFRLSRQRRLFHMARSLGRGSSSTSGTLFR